MMTPDFQTRRREELYGLLGILPDRNLPVTCRLVAVEEHEDFILERLVLDVQSGTAENPRGEVIPALFSHPKTEGPYPAVLFCHSHGGQYYKGKDELLHPSPYMYPVNYATALAKQGIAALAIDHWCFGERNGRTELSTFKSMLWHGEVMWGRMVYDSLKAMDYLLSRPDVDSARVGALGMSMGSTMAWWVSALDERVKMCVDICCLTDYAEIEKEDGLDRHGIYYYVPGLCLHFTSAQINSLIAPRPHLATVGKYDALTPMAGVDRIEAELQAVYGEMGVPENISVLRYPAGHLESAAMRADILAFLEKHL